MNFHLPNQSNKWAWIAGLLEGEGCFSLHQRKERRNTKSCAIHCEMTDEDVIRKLHLLSGVGTVNFRPSRKNRKPTWIWSVQKKVDILEILLGIAPFMGQRRLEKISELMEHIENAGY